MTVPSISNRLRRWWDGKYCPPDNDRSSDLVFLQGHHEQHWTSLASHAAWDYFKEHHRWIIGLLFGLLVAILVKSM